MMLVENISSKIRLHHNLYSLPVFGEYWEELLHLSLLEIGKDSDWQPNRSHSIGKDIVNSEYGKISCKSGDYNLKNNTLTLNGSRTTKYKTIEEKLKFLSEKTDDTYFCLARNKKEWNSGIKNYYLFIFDSQLLDYDKQCWESFNSGWKCNAKNYNAKIIKSMSDQLWTTINTNNIIEPKIISI